MNLARLNKVYVRVVILSIIVCIVNNSGILRWLLGVNVSFVERRRIDYLYTLVL